MDVSDAIASLISLISSERPNSLVKVFYTRTALIDDIVAWDFNFMAEYE